MSTISIIGAGNVGFHLAQRLYQCGFSIHQIYSRSLDNAQAAAQKVEAAAIHRLEQLDTKATIYILAVKDDAIAAVAQQLPPLDHAIVCHTSGSVASTALSQFDNYGVFYPLQTFSKQKEVDFEQLPFCIFGNNEPTQTQLQATAQAICPNVYLINDQQRAVLHVAAVMVNNFSNFLFHAADDICQQEEVPFDILKPLIQETVNKIQQHAPKAVQTGPAIRNDQQTIHQHLQFLEKQPHYKKIYQLLTDSIQAQLLQ